jgi:endonuclease YncB( thermonuclease family)
MRLLGAPSGVGGEAKAPVGDAIKRYRTGGGPVGSACKVQVVARMKTRTLCLFLRLSELPAVIGCFVLALAFVTSISNASPVDPSQVEVLDGDTIRTGGETFRLVGFDAPETFRAQCPTERELGNRATFRLRQLVAGGGLDLERLSCSCPRTEGTLRCNYGRSCGILRARGQDVGALLIAEGLAHAYVCGRTSCPRRKVWCSLLPNSDD